MLTSMEAQPLTFTHQAYSKKALFTIKISISPLEHHRSAYMLRKTGICPYIWWFWANIGRSAWFRPYIGKYGHGSFWYDLFSSIMVIYYTLSIYKDCSSYTAWSSACFRTCRECFLYIENYIFVYWTSNVSKRYKHYWIYLFQEIWWYTFSLPVYQRLFLYNALSYLNHACI